MGIMVKKKIKDMKREKQYEDSATFAGYALLALVFGIVVMIGLIIYNCIVYGIN
jgi:hypothetical protein